MVNLNREDKDTSLIREVVAIMGCSNFEQLWKAKALPNVLTTAWRMDKIPTRSNLNRRGVMVSTTSCALCQTKVETTQHLFLECKFGQSVCGLCALDGSISFFPTYGP